jgi:hypothetical protein
MPSRPPSCTACFPNSGFGDKSPAGLTELSAHKLAWLALLLAVTIVLVQVFQRFVQPALTPVLDDPVNRLVSLATVLTGVGIFVLHRTRAVSSAMLLRVGVAFELVVAFTIGMLETSRPFDPAVPLIGLSALGPWIVFVTAVVPRRPMVTLALVAASATMWPLAYWVNSLRLGFETASVAQVMFWPAINYLLAGLAFLVGMRTYNTNCQAQTAEDLGSYRLDVRIGEGGMGEVWRGSHKMLARPAAIKLLKPGAASKEDVFSKRFRREADAIASLQSPHTVYLYDFGITDDGRLYYVMELLDGISLQTLVTSFGPQPAARVAYLLRQICLSLEEAHAHQLVHRDLKPSNVMICRVAQNVDFVKVLDFGLAKSVGTTGSTQLTLEGVVTGTPGYMAPEVAIGNATIDARADIYALGCIAYVLLTGTLVFQDSNPLTMALNHVQTKPDPPSTRTELPIPHDLEQLVMRCLEKDPGDRPASARDIITALDQSVVSRGWDAREAVRWWERHLPPSSSLRSYAQTTPQTPQVVLRAS